VLTEDQKTSILEKMAGGLNIRQAFIDLDLSTDDIRGFREEKRLELRAIREALRIPTSPLEEWTQSQLQEEINRMEALKAAHPEKESRADARIAEVEALLE